jgi:hypothetical protein
MNERGTKERKILQNVSNIKAISKLVLGRMRGIGHRGLLCVALWVNKQRKKKGRKMKAERLIGFLYVTRTFWGIFFFYLLYYKWERGFSEFFYVTQVISAWLKASTSRIIEKGG